MSTDAEKLLEAASKAKGPVETLRAFNQEQEADQVEGILQQTSRDKELLQEREAEWSARLKDAQEDLLERDQRIASLEDAQEELKKAHAKELKDLLAAHQKDDEMIVNLSDDVARYKAEAERLQPFEAAAEAQERRANELEEEVKRLRPLEAEVKRLTKALEASKAEAKRLSEEPGDE